MEADDLAAIYLRALATADANYTVSLFTEDAVVHSPLYGPVAPAQFYPGLFTDTSAAHLTLHAVMRGKDERGATMVSFFFHFDWRLLSGLPARFDVVDVARLGSDGRVDRLHLIYDTVDVRPAFAAETGRQSRCQHQT